MPKLFDTHCHIQFNAFRGDVDEVVKNTLSQNVWFALVGSQKDTSKRGIEIAEKYDGVFAAVGLHPTHLFEMDIDEEEAVFKTRKEEFNYDYYKELAKSSKKVVAIGECGLEYHWLPKNIDENRAKQKQIDVFREHLDLANELNLPIICHIRDAHEQAIQILSEYIKNKKLSKKGVMHCFTGSPESARKYIELGFFISFTGIITFAIKKNKPNEQENLWQVVRETPIEKIMVETDAPYLSPSPMRGKRCLPEYVEFIAKKIAELKNMEYEDVRKITTKNALLFYGIENV